MRKLIIPKIHLQNIDEEEARRDFDSYFDDHFDDLIPYFSFIDHFNVIAGADPVFDDENQDGYYIYAFISPTNFLDDAIVQTKDYCFHTYTQYKRAVKEMYKELINLYKEWVNGLYEEK